MATYDRLPTDLRIWLMQAALPWSPLSALRVWKTAMKKHGGDRSAAQSYLSQLERKKLTQDVKEIWAAE